MPLIFHFVATLAISLVAGACIGCQQTKEAAPDMEGSYLTFTPHLTATAEFPAVYRLNEEECRELSKLEAQIQPDTPYLDLLPESGLPRFIIYPANGEVKQLDFYLYSVSIPQLSAKVNALVEKIKSRPGAQLQGEELRNWNHQTHDHS